MASPLVTAATCGDVLGVQRMIDEGMDPSIDDDAALRLSAEHGHYAVVKLLLQDERVDPASEMNHALRFSAVNGHAKVVSLLLRDERVHPAALNNKAITWSAWKGHVDVVRLLLADPRVNPAAERNFAIRFSSLLGHAKVVELLLEDDRVDPGAECNDAIGKSAEGGHIEVLQLLLADPRVDPSARDNHAIRVLTPAAKMRDKWITSSKQYSNQALRALVLDRRVAFRSPNIKRLPPLVADVFNHAIAQALDYACMCKGFFVWHARNSTLGKPAIIANILAAAFADRLFVRQQRDSYTKAHKLLLSMFLES